MTKTKGNHSVAQLSPCLQLTNVGKLGRNTNRPPEIDKHYENAVGTSNTIHRKASDTTESKEGIDCI